MRHSTSQPFLLPCGSCVQHHAGARAEAVTPCAHSGDEAQGERGP